MRTGGAQRGRRAAFALFLIGCSAESASSLQEHVSIDGGSADARTLGGGSTDSIGAMPTPSIDVQPRDLTTAYDRNVIDIEVSTPFGEPDRSWLASGVRLTRDDPVA